MKTALVDDQIVTQSFEYQPMLRRDFDRHQRDQTEF
jgi:hypothetical protein